MDAPGNGPEAKLPKPKDLSHHLSRTTRARPPSNIKQFYKYFALDGIGQFAGGLPNHKYFPFDTLEASVATPERFEPSPNDPVDPPGDALSSLSLSSSKPPSQRLHIPKYSDETDPIRKIDVASALQYQTAHGYPPLESFLITFTREVLHPDIPYAGGPDILLSTGNTDGFAKTMDLLVNDWSAEVQPVSEKEGLLVEEYAYMAAVQDAKPRGVNIVPVKIDNEGMLPYGPGGLQEVLMTWDHSKGKRPHMLYTVPVGQNPTTGVLSTARRKQIYSVCQKYDIIIIEDDPYWYLQYPSAITKNLQSGKISYHPNTATKPGRKSSGYEFLDSLVPSYLSLDVDGRVIRLDTFSKTIAPGCRLGWVTAQPLFIERLARITETSTQSPSGFVQSMVAKLVMAPPGTETSKRRHTPTADPTGWDVSGWVRWLEGLRGRYERRMNLICNILEEGKHTTRIATHRSTGPGPDSDEPWLTITKTEMYDFAWPMGGMFLWLTVHFSAHPLAGRVAGATLSRALWVFWTTKPFRVLGMPGTIFAPTDEITSRDGFRHFRFCFAAPDEEELEPITRRLGDCVRVFWEITDEDEIKRILDEDEGRSAAVYAGAPRARIDLPPGPCC